MQDELFSKIIRILFSMNLEKELQSLGLGEKEAKTYIAALEIGKGTAQEIAKKAGLSRPTTYFVLERLMKMGLVSCTNEEKHQCFVPESPTQLKTLLDEQERAIELKREKTKTIVRELELISVAKTGEPIVKYYLGKEGILRMAKAIPKPKNGEEMWTAYSEESVTNYITPEERSLLSTKRISAKMSIVAIYSTKTGIPIPERNGTCVPEKEYPLPADIAVFEDKIRITSFEDEVGIVIRNTVIAKTFRTLFKLAQLGAEQKKNKNIEEK